MRRFAPVAFALFVAGGLLSSAFALSNLLVLSQQRGRSSLAPEIATPAPLRDEPRAQLSILAPTPAASRPAVQSGTSGTDWWFLFVVDGNVWASDGGHQYELTRGSQIAQPTLRDDAIAFVKRGRNGSDIWLASADSPLQPITQNTSSVVAQNRWAAQPVFVPGAQRLLAIGDFDKSSTAPGGLAVWQLGLQEHSVVQLTNPPAYAGGDQDVTVNPLDPRQIIFTRYAYQDLRLVEQLQWMNVPTRALSALTPPDQPSRQASFAPDGVTLAFVQAGQGANQDLYIGRLQVSSSGGAQLEDVRQVATAMIANPVWSPDGASLVYIALTKDQFQLFSLDLKRGGQPRQVTKGPPVDATSRPLIVTPDQLTRIREWLSLN